MRRTLARVKALGPDSLTVHSLAIKRAARLNMFKEQYEELAITNTQEMIELTAACAREMGLLPTTCTGRKIWPGILKMWLRGAGKGLHLQYSHHGRAADHRGLRGGHHDEGIFPRREPSGAGGECEERGAVHRPPGRDDGAQGKIAFPAVRRTPPGPKTAGEDERGVHGKKHLQKYIRRLKCK